MRYFVTEQTPTGYVKHGPLTAQQAISVIRNIDLPESKIYIKDEKGERVDKIDLQTRAENEGSE